MALRQSTMNRNSIQSSRFISLTNKWNPYPNHRQFLDSGACVCVTTPPRNTLSNYHGKPLTYYIHKPIATWHATIAAFIASFDPLNYIVSAGTSGLQRTVRRCSLHQQLHLRPLSKTKSTRVLRRSSNRLSLLTPVMDATNMTTNFQLAFGQFVNITEIYCSGQQRWVGKHYTDFMQCQWGSIGITQLSATIQSDRTNSSTETGESSNDGYSM
ncbi:uncharacterized protein EDB91DRAFT_1112525 [Suillus paluster]|uniref:uncharacterized protein n=1 Tax=Suillus paluster TaxID=48578 RepID=UPI001B869084|nr:uncharacterized protein EDB91DRAFT_1112525 [Suillus paluster]KAG1749109.1 hypothetical protein EDB91DRAFT_1112525 [Suillus paluster]